MNDCALALLANRRGDTASYQYLLWRAQLYRNLIDPASGFVRPRNPDGTFLASYSPTGSTGFKEGTAWHYTWLVPQDITGLAAAQGGTSVATGRLDTLFGLSGATVNTASWNGSGTYNARNETDLQAPWLYSYLGANWKTAAVVQAALASQYSTASDGIPGNDDLGTMSSWYVLASMGLYPVLAGADQYVLTAPTFDTVVVHLRQPYYTGSTFTIGADRPSSGARYVASATLNGAGYSRNVLSHADLAAGADLRLTLGTGTNATWGSGANQVSPLCAATPNVATVSAATTASVKATAGSATTATSSVTATKGNAGSVTVTLQLPRGWSAASTSAAVGGLAAGSSATQHWTITPPAGTANGSYEYRVTVTWAGPNGTGAAVRTLAIGHILLG